MKILYIVKTQLHYYPPCISQIRMIKDLGYDIEVLYGTSNENIIKLLNKENIPCHKVAKINERVESKIVKLIDWYKFRKGVLKKIRTYKGEIILWFGTAESILPLKGALNDYKYILSLLELLDDCPQKVKLLKNIAQNAIAVTVSEETRGYIMRSWWKLKGIPYVFPNKPYNQITEKYCTPSSEVTKNVIDKIKNKKVILYQGILQNTDEILQIAMALKKLKENYILLLMGIDKYNSMNKIKEAYANIVYVNYIPAPYHLEVTSYAHIGIVFYRNDSLNKVYCAPNKIYEYSGFGIPMLANDIPGLKNTIGRAGAGECIELVTENIIEAIEKIELKYEIYSKNAKKFFKKTDNLETMKKLFKGLVK